jgi:predicted dehydrogenase
MRTPTSLGVVGLGAWGTALVRTLDELPSAQIRWLLDQSPAAAMRVWRRVPYARVAARFEDLLEDETLDAVIVATPPAARAEHVRRALDAGKHVLVEPPIALEAGDADDLVRRAETGKRRLVAGHALRFHPGAHRLRELVTGGRLGEIFYVYGSHQGLGRAGDSVLWGAGAQAVSGLLWLVGDEPVEVIARGGPCAGADGADVAFCHLRFATGIEGELRLSAVEPARTQRLTAVGSRGMAVFDELDAEHPLTLHETAEDAGGAPSRGDAWAPRLPRTDPVRAYCAHFLAAASAPGSVSGGGRDGAAVVAVLEALQRSLERGGTREAIGPVGEPIAGVIRLPIRSV